MPVTLRTNYSFVYLNNTFVAIPKKVFLKQILEEYFCVKPMTYLMINMESFLFIKPSIS
jgi:hypothetical protein